MSDFQVFMSIFEQREYDVVTRLQLPPSPMVFDLGGNVGLATRRMSMLLPGATFLAVEPDPNNREMFRKNNRALLEAGRLTLLEGFVAFEDGTASIDRSEGAASAFRMRTAETLDKEVLPCFSIETLIKKAAVETVDLAKVDIEGAEQKVFANCTSWIHRIKSIVIECHEPYSYDMFFADLNRVGWKFDVVDRNNAMTCVRRV